jgi:nitrite reductase/ring-hydroxylating ferredoxin subunit
LSCRLIILLRKEVDFAGGKVLVARLGDKVVSTSAFCSHYGASLAKGVLTSDGRITCPWHGACFNASTGDIEDAPAPNAIHSFPVHLEGGKIMVTADPKYTKKDDNCVRAPNIVSSFDEVTSGVVIVGGGAGTIHALQSLREVSILSTISTPKFYHNKLC